MKSLLRFPRLSVWHFIFTVIILGGLRGLYIRAVYGLGAATNLTDRFPWGLWKGFNVLTGIGLGAGGFTVAATVHILNLKRYKPILRIALLTAFLGYSLMVVALMIDIGQPQRIWHPIVMWNEHSVLFEVAWCVMLYLTVLSLEFAPAVCERFGWRKVLSAVRLISAPVVIFGVVLSTLHQSSLGTLFLIVPEKLYGLWYTPLLPGLFFISAVCAGLAMVIFACWQSSQAFGRQVPAPLLEGVSRVLAILLLVYQSMRFVDLFRRDALRLLMQNRMETWLFGLETALLVAPLLLLLRPSNRANPGVLYLCSLMVLFGFVANRLNVSITGLEASQATHYIPKWPEVMITLSLISIGFAIFRMAALHLPLFVEPNRVEEPEEELVAV
jgi:Ni/Fe-hydrogenase subunit HybB-like protein